ncbi:MAG: hypothetical protein K8T91_01160 [Planctomycetes bacterium]|nr:hypothetical protein [Planctomycetota bacterium]
MVELLVVIAVIVILIALLLPAINASRASSRTAKCLSQLSEVGKALHGAGIERITASSATWTTALAPYLDHAGSLLHCPDDFERPTAVSYGLNTRTYRMSGGDSQRIMALDYKQPQANVVGPQGTDDWLTSVPARHRGQLNVLYYDNSVQLRRPDAIDPRICRIHDETWRPLRDSKLIKPGCTSDVSLVTPVATTTGSSTTTTTTTTGTTTAGGTTTTGSTTSATTTGGTTTGGTTTGSPPPDLSCYDPDQGFPELQGYTITAFCGGNPFTGVPIVWDPDSPRFMLMAQSCNEYILWFEDWGDIGTASQIDLAFNPVRQADGSIKLCVTQLAGSVCSYTVRDNNGNALAGLTNWSGNASPGTKRCATNLIPGAVGRLCSCPPTVDAGPDRTTVMPGAAASLNGVTSDGTVTWTQVSGPAGVVFATPNAPVTTATFPGAGSYVLRLTGTNAVGSSSDTATVVVYAEGTFQPGLKAEYFDGSNTWTGTPLITRVDPDLNFPWPINSLTNQPGPDQFSVRWTGQIKANFSETYQLHVSHDDGAWVEINGVQVYGSTGWGSSTTFYNSSTFAMTAGQWVTITVRMTEGGGGDHLGVKWSSPSTPQQFIPGANLRTPP